MPSEELTNEPNVAAEELRAFIERIERLAEEKKEIGDDIKDVYGEAKGRGYDTRVMKMIVAMRKQAPNERAEMEAIKELYMDALGMGFQERLPFGDESPRTRKRETTVQLCDGDGNPLHDPAPLGTIKAAVDAVKGKGGKPKAKRDPSADPDERLRDERAKGPVFA